MWFEPFYKMDAKSYDASNFILSATPETCKGCGLCAKRCPMEALVMEAYPVADPKLNRKGRVPILKTQDCIGCGVCVVKCPTQSLILIPRSNETHPPKTALEWTKDYWRVRKEKS